MSKYLIITSSAIAGIFIVFSAFSGCGKGVTTDANASGSANQSPPTTTTPGGGSINPGGTPGGCPAEQIAVYNFAQGNAAQNVIDLDLSGSSSILFVSVGGQEVSYTFDPSAGAVTLSDAGQPGEQIEIEVCLPSPIGKPAK